MPSSTFRKSLVILSHPVTLGALALLLLNDHLFRRLWPSWWTGKLGDFAWLWVAPFALIAILAWLVPSFPGHERLVGGLSFSLVGGVFILAKTVPEVHAWVVWLGERLTGFQLALRMDPTDLIALLSLLAGWRLWQRGGEQPISRSRLGWVALPLAALLTIANSARPDVGVSCVAILDGRLIALAGNYHQVESVDGGLSWQASPARWKPCDSYQTNNSFTDPSNPSIVYRYVPGVRIERSENAGMTWTETYPLRLPSQAERAYLEKSLSNVRYQDGPIAGVVDPRSGNTVFAMGQQGVLVRKTGGEWVWVTVDRYDYNLAGQPNTVRRLTTLLTGEMILAAGLGLLYISRVAGQRSQSRVRNLLWGIALALWGLIVLAFPPALMNGGYSGIFVGTAMIGAALFIVPLSLNSVFYLGSRSVGLLVRALGISLIVAVFFFLPYLLWVLNALPSYTLAMAFGLALGFITILVGTRRANPRTLPPAQDNNLVTDH